MDQIRGEKIVLNGKPADASGYFPDATAGFYYEVIRVMDGKYLFLDDHLERLRASCFKGAHGCPSGEELKTQLFLLLQTEKFREGNVKLVLYLKEGRLNTGCYFIPHRYPDKQEYREGIAVRTYRFTRPDPNIKRWNQDFRSQVDAFIRETGIYEAVLVNENGILTEGSRSNLFFTGKDGTVTTTPVDLVLPGITRKHILTICRDLGIKVNEKAVRPEDAPGFNGCFISGTSPKVLPVHRLDGITFDPEDPLVQQIRHAYDALVIKSMDS